MNRTARTLLFIAGALTFVLGTVCAGAQAEKKIGVLLWSDDLHYREARDGFMEEMGKAGFGEPPVSYLVENAKGDKAKAAEIARKFAAVKFDMIVPVGTSAAVAVSKEVKDIPVVFCVVYDPVESKIAQDWKSSGNNTTGTSSRVPMSALLENVKKLAPVKSLAVLYTPGEKNSEAQLKDLQALETEFAVKIIPIPLATREEVAPRVSDIAARVDALYLSGSSIVGDMVPAIVDIATKAGVITVTHQGEKVEKGVLLGIYANSRALGRLAGEKAVSVLRGAKPSSLPIEALTKLDVMVNMKTAKAGNIVVPAIFLQRATRVIE